MGQGDLRRESEEGRPETGKTEKGRRRMENGASI
jgi:hypothetical protein